MLRAICHHAADVSSILRATNALLAADLDGGRFVTCFLGLLDENEVMKVVNDFQGYYMPDDPGNVDARDVWWGTTDEAMIEAAISDHLDDPRYGIVFYQPWALLAGDVDGSGYVDDDDLSVLLANWGMAADWSGGDLNGDAAVNDDDLSLLLSHWNEGIPPTTSGVAVPEPATVFLFIFGALADMTRRRSISRPR